VLLRWKNFRRHVPAIACTLVLSMPFGTARAGKLNNLYTFTGGADGGTPTAVIRDSQGNLYGTTIAGGASNLGTVFKLAPDGTETVLYSFIGAPDGLIPRGRLAMDLQGNLYGVTQLGGAYNYGTIFKVTPGGAETVIHSFDSGDYPRAGLIIDATRDLYGATTGGGFGYGTVFRFRTVRSAVHKDGFTQLYRFAGGEDGADPEGDLLRDENGNLYGTTHSGGAHQRGTVFRLGIDGSRTVLYAFSGSDGSDPGAGLTLDQEGNLYGTTIDGGDFGVGNVFSLSPNGVLTTLYAFKGGTDGAYPDGNLIRDEQGNVYGTTAQGGDRLLGEVFEVSPDGNLTVLHSFAGGSDGDSPNGTLITDGQGNLYGTTYYGGKHDAGIVFSISE
jgi:uncharacterized repeat protein (TIGR03803 family)